MRVVFALVALFLLLVVFACAAPQPARPTVNHFYANPAHVSQGNSCTLNWKVTGADTVTIDHGLGTVPATGSRTVSPDETTVYELTAANRSGVTVADTSVTVSTSPPAADMPVINHFESTPNAVMPGGIATLVWNVTDASSVSIDQGVGEVQHQDRKGVIPSGTTRYTLTAVSASGEVSAFTNVVVTAPATGQPPAELVSPQIQQQVIAGQPFTINLDASPATGFQWELDYYDPDFVSLEGNEYKPYSVPQAGATGSQQFTFNALKVGDTTIKLSYAHGNEPLNSSSKYYKVHIIP
ncbi:MAG: hypothetical protein A2Z36_00070 [Chloroflexi bacterium RBG_19FT_COMBO_48_23]|nr:MAG: hypothetical protein A2Z36_00070 [Chloroflexi bacterium RBG_19FT_COMBO_48_23]